MGKERIIKADVGDNGVKLTTQVIEKTEFFSSIRDANTQKKAELARLDVIDLLSFGAFIVGIVTFLGPELVKLLQPQDNIDFLPTFVVGAIVGGIGLITAHLVEQKYERIEKELLAIDVAPNNPKELMK